MSAFLEHARVSIRRRLTRQLLRLLLGYSLALSIPLAAINAWLGYEQETERQQAEVEAVMSLFGLQLRQAVWDFDERTVHDVLSGLRYFPALQAVEVNAPDLRASYIKAGTGLAHAGPERHYPLLAPNGSMVIGELVLRLDEASLSAAVWSGVGAVVAMIALELLLFAGVIFFLVERRIASPVLALSRHVHELTPNRLNEPAPVPSTPRRNELHDLAEGVTRLQRELCEQLAERDAIARTLQDNEARLTLMADSIPHQLWTAEPKGTLTYASQRALDYFGIDFEQLAQRPLTALVHPEDADEAESRLQQALQAGTPLHADLRLRRHDGAYRWHAVMAVPQRDESGAVTQWFGSSTDISERKRGEEELLQSHKMTAIGQLAGGIAHDFNNQLTVIFGYTELLGRSARDDRTRELAGGILQSAQRCRDLTRDLLAFSRKQPLARATVDVHQLIEDTSTLLARSLDKRIELVRALRAPSATVRGDASQLQNALLNLALNARDAMPEGGTVGFSTSCVELSAAAGAERPVQLAQLSPGAYLCVAVEDSGTGMTEAVRQRIFEPFFTTKPPGEGTGMGLPSVYGTVQSHGGAITVESRLGHGTTFRIYLPVEAAAQAPATRPEASSVAPATSALRVLVIDDEANVRALLAEILREAGHEPRLAASGDAAIRLFAESPDDIDLVILDMMMPGLSGKDTFRRLRSVRPDLKVLIASGFDSGGAIAGMLDEGAIALLPKPFDRQQLLTAIGRAVNAPNES